jgi:glycosyltransferase involved in cell wall biosynthesis
MESNTRCDILLITNSFPYGTGESFIELEIPRLLANFDTVYILPFKMRKGTGELAKRDIDPRVQIVLPSQSVIDKSIPSLNYLFPTLLLFCRVFFMECSDRRSFKKVMKPRNLLLTFIRTYRGVLYKKEYAAIVNRLPLKNHIVYSYWTDAWLTGILDYHRRKDKNRLVVSRAHRGDLYDEASMQKYQTARKFIFRYIDYVFPISTSGYTYLTERYEELKNKCKVHYLGIKLYEAHLNNEPPAVSAQFVTASCSFVTKVKRVDLIIKALACVDRKIRITHHHFGDGPLMEELKSLTGSLPENINFVWHGYKSQNELYDFYANNPIDLFMNVSESEGLPVSIMEAMSFGIPVIATDVGGTSDAVDASVGYLIPMMPDLAEITGLLEKHIVLDTAAKQQYRRSAKEKAFEKFNSEVNYDRFHEDLYNLSSWE